MGSIQSGLRAIFEDEERGITTPDAVVGAVAARIGRGRAGRVVGVTAGTLTLAGFAAAVPFVFSNLGSPDLAPAGTPAVTATYLMPENPLGLRCGDPVPSSLLDSLGRGEFNVYEDAVQINHTSGGGAVYYPLPSASAPAEAQVHAFYETRFSGVIIALDGRVVAWTEPTTPVSGSIVLREAGLDEPHSEVDVVVITSGRPIWCPEAGGQAEVDGVPAPGFYLTYPYVDPNSR